MALNYYNSKNIANASSTVEVSGVSYWIEHEVTSVAEEGCVLVRSFVYQEEVNGNRRCLGSASMEKAGESMSTSLKGIPFGAQASVIARIYADINEILTGGGEDGTE